MPNPIIKKGINIKDLSSSDLLSPEVFDFIKYKGSECIDSLDWDGALDLADTLELKLEGHRPAGENEIYYFNILYFWYLKLKLFALRNEGLQQQRDLIKKNIVEMLNFGLDVKYAIFRILDFFNDDQTVKSESLIYLGYLNQSEAVLGSSDDQFIKNNFRPTVGNWIKEYQTVLKAIGGVKVDPGAFHIVKFLNSSPLVKFLSIEEKETLKVLLDLYNWLLDPITYEKTEKNQTVRTPYSNEQKLELPEELQKPEPVVKLPPVAPVPPNAPKLKPMGEISNLTSKPLTLSKPPVSGYKAAATKGVSARGLLSQSDDGEKGLKMSWQNPEQDIQVKQQEIDKKLEDLEKRIKK